MESLQDLFVYPITFPVPLVPKFPVPSLDPYHCSFNRSLHLDQMLTTWTEFPEGQSELEVLVNDL